MCVRPTLPSNMGWNYYLCGFRAAETISHIRMQKLIERDVGDEEREQRQLFVTSFYLTGIIRYMKLKFLTRGFCWQHYFLFRSSPFFFCAPVYANLDPVFFPWSLKKEASCLKNGLSVPFTAHWRAANQLIQAFELISVVLIGIYFMYTCICPSVWKLFKGRHVCAFTAVQPWLCCECFASCEPSAQYHRGTSDKRTLWFGWNYGLCHLSPQN